MERIYALFRKEFLCKIEKLKEPIIESLSKNTPLKLLKSDFIKNCTTFQEKVADPYELNERIEVYKLFVNIFGKKRIF